MNYEEIFIGNKKEAVNRGREIANGLHRLLPSGIFSCDVLNKADTGRRIYADGTLKIV